MKQGTDYLEHTFFHIPPAAVHGPSRKVKAFWLICMSSFAVYVAYTSLSIVVEYFTQKTVMVVEIEKLEHMPELKMCILSSWAVYDFPWGQNENFDRYREAFGLYENYKRNLQDNATTVNLLPVSVANYSQFIRSLMGTASLYLYYLSQYYTHHGESAVGHRLDTAILEADGVPRYCFPVSYNKSIHGDVIKIYAELVISCNWTRLPYSIKPPQFQVYLQQRGSMEKYFILADPDKDSAKPLVFWAKATKTRRLTNCEKNRAKGGNINGHY